MAMFVWSDSYSVKVGLCDAQHKQLFTIINNLADAMRMGKGGAVIGKTVDELLQYTRTHFQQEEALLRRAHYPQLLQHQQLHRRFIADVEGFQRQLHAGATSNSVQVLTMLRDWLLNHIQQTDQAYSGCLNSVGIH